MKTTLSAKDGAAGHPIARVAGSALGWAGLVAAFTTANLALFLAFSSVIKF